MDLELIKERVSDLLLDLNDVSGVSVEGGHLVVYVVEDSARVRGNVAAVVERESPGTKIDYVRSGRFRPF